MVTSGFALTLAQARQLCAHGHFMVNGRRASSPSIQLRPGDVVEPREKQSTRTLVSQNLDLNKSGFVPGWLEVSQDSMQTKMVSMPTRTDFPFPIQEQLIIELASK